jgi:hypothetical protein
MARKTKTANSATPKAEFHKINEQLLSLKIPIGMLTLDPDNARDHNEQNIESIKSSLDDFGQRKCIVVKKSDMSVIAGNGTVTSAKQLGWTHIAALVTDDDEVTAAAYALADNRTGELATWNYDRLIKTMSALHKGGFDLIKLGWTGDETRMMMQLDSGAFADMQRLNVDATLSNSVVRELGEGKESNCEKNEQWFYCEFYKDEDTFNRLVEKLRPYMRTEHEISSDLFAQMVDAYIADHAENLPPTEKKKELEPALEQPVKVIVKKEKETVVPPKSNPKRKCTKKGKGKAR